MKMKCFTIIQKVVEVMMTIGIDAKSIRYIFLLLSYFENNPHLVHFPLA